MTTVISRANAGEKIRKHQEAAIVAALRVGISVHRYTTAARRNYEIEQDLERIFGGRWVIHEWCPYDGVFCRWVEHAPEAHIEAQIEVETYAGGPYQIRVDWLKNRGGAVSAAA